ncbi:MAG TPA: Sua5/YciO/YrdC/YwlC family protein [Thermoleophilaceae bacterium]|nr:Sua5/YciO/YrdC/YwlC family protein [Thermoleophilaceae bacterium]
MTDASTAPLGGARRLTHDAAAAFERCIGKGGVAVFPADTVYGLAAAPDCEPAVRRLHELKRRDPAQPSAVMFFALAPALAALPELGPRTRAVFERLLPGPLTLIVANPGGRFPLACGADPRRLGVRVPALGGPLAPLTAVAAPVLQSSANLHGGPDPRRLADVPPDVRAGVDLVLDGGELPGVASTVVDLSGYESDGRFDVLREGALPAAELARLLADVD